MESRSVACDMDRLNRSITDLPSDVDSEDEYLAESLGSAHGSERRNSTDSPSKRAHEHNMRRRLQAFKELDEELGLKLVNDHDASFSQLSVGSQDSSPARRTRISAVESGTPARYSPADSVESPMFSQLDTRLSHADLQPQSPTDSRSRLARMQEVIDQLNEAVQESQNLNESLLEDKKDMVKKCAELTAAERSARSRIAEATARAEAEAQARKSLETELEQVQADKKRLQQRYQQVLDELDIERGKLQQEQTRAERQTAEIKRLQASLDTARSKVQQANQAAAAPAHPPTPTSTLARPTSTSRIVPSPAIASSARPAWASRASASVEEPDAAATRGNTANDAARDSQELHQPPQSDTPSHGGYVSSVTSGTGFPSPRSNHDLSATPAEDVPAPRLHPEQRDHTFDYSPSDTEDERPRAQEGGGQDHDADRQPSLDHTGSSQHLPTHAPSPRGQPPSSATESITSRLAPPPPSGMHAAPGPDGVSGVREDRLGQPLAQFVEEVIEGMQLVKYGRKGWPHKRVIWVSLPGVNTVEGSPGHDTGIPHLCWCKPTDLGDETRMRGCIGFDQVSNIGVGISTPVFQKKGKRKKEPLYFSIIGMERTLDLEAESEERRDFLARSFRTIFEDPDSLYSTVHALQSSAHGDPPSHPQNSHPLHPQHSSATPVGAGSGVGDRGFPPGYAGDSDHHHHPYGSGLDGSRRHSLTGSVSRGSAGPTSRLEPPSANAGLGGYR